MVDIPSRMCPELGFDRQNQVHPRPTTANGSFTAHLNYRFKVVPMLEPHF